MKMWLWLVLCGILWSSTALAGTVNIVPVPSTQTVVSGATFDVLIQVQAGSQPIDTVETHVDFTPSVFTVNSVTMGSTMPAFGNQAPVVDNSGGHVDYLATLNFPATATGTFSLMTLHCVAVGVGTSAVAFADVIPRETAAFLAGDDMSLQHPFASGSVDVAGGACDGPISNILVVP